MYQYSECNSIDLYGLTLLLLYYNINEYSSSKKKLCEILNPFLPFNKIQIAKKYIDDNVSDCNSLNVKDIDKIFDYLDIQKTLASKKEKCSVISNVHKIFNSSKQPFIILDNQHILFNTPEKKILFNINHNILCNQNTETWQISLLLQKYGIIPDIPLYLFPRVRDNWNKLIKDYLVTKEKFPRTYFYSTASNNTR